MKTITLSFVLGFIAITLSAQNKHKEMAYQAYLTTNKSLWKQLIATCEKEATLSSNSEAQLELALARHGLLAATMVDQDEDLFDDYLDTTEEDLEKLMEDTNYEGEARALLSSIWGFEMGYSPMKGMFLGGKSSSYIEKATKLSPESPIVWQIMGSSKLFTPSMFGGSVTESIAAFEKSISLYEANPEYAAKNWRYLEAMAWLGQAYEKNGEMEKAVAVYQKALQVEPNFNWVKKVLLPNATASTQ